MTYSIAGHEIRLDKVINHDDEEMILRYKEIFKICLNDSNLKLLISVKKLVHLYSDIIMIYSTLLNKIPNYEDIRLMTLNVKKDSILVENKFNEIFSKSINEVDIFSKKMSWQTKKYESIIKPLTKQLLELTLTFFEKFFKTLTCIQLFFESFNNLKKLLIPFLVDQTHRVIDSLKKSIFFVNFPTITDNLDSITELTPTILKQLKKIEKITKGIGKETTILNEAFKRFEPTLQQYTQILLGKAILKRSISDEDCKIINRRDICYQAAEHVVSIPLTEEQKFQFFSKYIIIVILVLMLLVVTTIFRFFRVVF
ncbi:hypothetical protein CLIB1444_18S00430 [[Candida] jaroonii]|uniref:Uncharacterized protein n=1 Tax=[Candida] jaroonii TaxID=467808 RepID=A0ACA9YG42_9ASCO|nr:hypothetical protein CLIB1444_18S00430 [[Candida] jaroonii]